MAIRDWHGGKIAVLWGVAASILYGVETIAPPVAVTRPSNEEIIARLEPLILKKAAGDVETQEYLRKRLQDETTWQDPMFKEYVESLEEREMLDGYQWVARHPIGYAWLGYLALCVLVTWRWLSGREN